MKSSSQPFNLHALSSNPCEGTTKKNSLCRLKTTRSFWEGREMHRAPFLGPFAKILEKLHKADQVVCFRVTIVHLGHYVIKLYAM